MGARAKEPIVITMRAVLVALRSEAEKVWMDPRIQRSMAQIAARDLISAGRVTVVKAGLGRGHLPRRGHSRHW